MEKIDEEIREYLDAESDLEKARNRAMKAANDYNEAAWRMRCARIVADLAVKERDIEEAVRDNKLDMVPEKKREAARNWLQMAASARCS